ncbi:MAG: hypothetical protein OXE17_00035 [Chloroflexi bacterium]|nr:hypothetical protein [Chloroflexota bacterium]
MWTGRDDASTPSLCGRHRSVLALCLRPERRDRLECSAAEARVALAQRRKMVDDVNAVAAYARERTSWKRAS